VGTSRKLKMTDAEIDAFLGEERVLRLATIDEAGWPAVVPVWFVWWDGAIWLWNLDRADRTARLHAGTRMSLCVDGGVVYAELRGLSARTDYRFVADDDVPLEVRALMGRKYFDLDEPIAHVDDHTWIRCDLHEVQTWDFRKVYGG
jgi:hypothetical protein